MWKIIVLCTILGLAIAEKARFNNYKVFRLIPTTKSQVEILHEFEVSDGFSFWEAPSFVGKNVDLMVAPHKLPEFYEIMGQLGIPYQVHIEDIQTLIDETTPLTRSKSFDFTSYHTLDEIYKNLDDLTAQYANKVQTIVGGKTYEGREIKGVKVSFKKNNPGIFIEGGIHAREWITPATTMYILHQLLASNDSDVRALAESHDWYIFPSFNPDGYVYTHTTNRLWRKTRKPYGICYGSDPNRNWDYRWNTGGASSNPCSETHAGSAPFSDIETKSMSEYLKSIDDKFYAYISLHSYSQLLMFPYGHTTDHLENYDELYAIGSKSIEALKQRYGTEYVTGNIAETIYVATGSTVDYIKGVHKKVSYTYELRDQGRYGFLLPPKQIIPTGEETLDSLVAMFKEAKKRGHPKRI
ncbi:LOW QUALITY PROTEIN: zinc carboxypeptidase-like [Nylanderia fulva]|uniref:LOW QUALITY PROTEIN: zinc carboxypeptidase-like n=1 Tax=Nylanderia fulva TaxID=613905 RepID=UPI0010FB65F3|nr:LOW QUALITY PROTEIN: zinc carboxypeptidase-like [Nylanderia fulva]